MPDFLQNLLDRVGGVRQAAIILVGVLVTGAVYGVSQWATKPHMVPLLTNISASNAGKMKAKLTELGIASELGDGGNAILVDSADVAKARVELASAGLTETGRPGLELFDKPAWGMTDFTQKVNFRRAMEGELERNIGTMTGVKSVQVHLALEDDQIFKQNDRPSKASVTLTMADGATPASGTVKGITRLVAGSVGGLTPDNVTVVDERGQALTLDNSNSVAGLTSQQLEQQIEVERQLKAKVEKLLVPTYGEGNARVEISAQLNFDRVERTTQSIDPDKQAVLNERADLVTPSTPAQGAAQNNTSTSYDYTRENTSYVGAVGAIKKLTVAVLIADKVTMPAPATDTGAKAKAAAALVPPTITPRTADELANAEKLVRGAIGADSTRGDVVSVVSAPFYMAPPPVQAEPEPALPLTKQLLANPKPVVSIAALVVVLIIALVMLGALRQKKPALNAQSQNTLPSSPDYAQLPASSQMQDAMQQSLPNGMQSNNGNNMLSSQTNEFDTQPQYDEQRRPVHLPPPPTTEEREQAMATVQQRPEAAIRVSKAWLRADN